MYDRSILSLLFVCLKFEKFELRWFLWLWLKALGRKMIHINAHRCTLPQISTQHIHILWKNWLTSHIFNLCIIFWSRSDFPFLLSSSFLFSLKGVLCCCCCKWHQEEKIGEITFRSRRRWRKKIVKRKLEKSRFFQRKIEIGCNFHSLSRLCF